MVAKRWNSQAAHDAAVQAARLRHRYGTSDAREAFNAAVAAKMTDGRMKRSDALMAVGRDDPELWAAYRAWRPAPAPAPEPHRTTVAQQRATAIRDQWEAAISERMQRRALSRYQAILAVGKELPDLYRAYSGLGR